MENAIISYRKAALVIVVVSSEAKSTWYLSKSGWYASWWSLKRCDAKMKYTPIDGRIKLSTLRPIWPRIVDIDLWICIAEPDPNASSVVLLKSARLSWYLMVLTQIGTTPAASTGTGAWSFIPTTAMDKDPDDDKLKFVLVTKPSHGRIVQFSSSTSTLAYVPDENYGGKDDFASWRDWTSRDAKVSIKIEKNERLANDQVQGSDRQQKKETSINPPQMGKRSLKRRTMAVHLLAIRTNSHLVQHTEQQIKNQKQEEQPTSQTFCFRCIFTTLAIPSSALPWISGLRNTK